MVSQKLFDEYCKDTSGFCIIAFLPSIADRGLDKRNEYIAYLQDIREKYLSQSVNFLWAEGGTNFELEEFFGLGFGYPAVIGMNKRKGRYSVMRS